MATIQQMANTTPALTRSEKGRMERSMGLQMTKYLSREKHNMVKTFAYEALNVDINNLVIVNLKFHLSEIKDLSLQKASENG